MSHYKSRLARLIVLLLLSCNGFSAPDKMVYIEGGLLTRGIDYSKYQDQHPRHTVAISHFYLDETLVTIADYEYYTKKTGYKNRAETLGYCQISKEGMKNWEWHLVLGANFRYPFGKDSKIQIKDEMPATCLSALDAIEYCKHLNKRLPTEAEWEYAMRAGSTERFPWGNNAKQKGVFQFNFWQGAGHEKAEEKDGFTYLSSVKAFPPNGFGLYDPVGNVWQITGDYYSVLTYIESQAIFLKTGKPEQNPKGPNSGKSYVTRGGSWWCSETTCNGFGLVYRGHIHKDAVFNNNGFRCARNIDFHKSDKIFSE